LKLEAMADPIARPLMSQAARIGIAFGVGTLVGIEREQSDSAGDLNLLSPALIRDLRETAAGVPEGVAVLTVTGGGDGLTDGLKLDELKDRSATEARNVLRDLRGATRNVRDAGAVTVCGWGGYALGAGLELAMACDFRVVEREAVLGLPEVGVGLVTGIQGGLLVRLVGLQAAKELVYTGEPVSGEEAAELGLLNRAVPADEHDGAVADRVETGRRRLAPGGRSASSGVSTTRWNSSPPASTPTTSPRGWTRSWKGVTRRFAASDGGLADATPRQTRATPGRGIPGFIILSSLGNPWQSQCSIRTWSRQSGSSRTRQTTTRTPTAGRWSG
jgi:enoyl-CoA hydratase/carnithine racemase